MSSLFNIEDSLPNKISYWHLAAFLILLPYDGFYTMILLVSFAAHTLIHCRKAYFKSLLSKEVLLLVSLYVLSWIALVYSPDKKEGLNILGRQQAIFIFPVLMALSGLNREKYLLPLCRLFAFSCTVAVLYLYFDALRVINHFHLPLSSMFSLVFMNHNFSLPLHIHATYLSMYVAFSIIILAWSLSLEKNRIWKLVHIVCLLFLSAGLMQLSSRAVFIALLVVVNLVFPFLVFAGKQRTRFMVVSLLLSSAVFFAIAKIDAFKVRYVNDLKKDLVNRGTLVEIDEPRVDRWKVIGEMILKSPVIGYGTGAEKNMLQEKYYEKKLFNSYLNEFNTHSEYLSLLMKMGAIGLTLFLYILFTGFSKAWKKRQPAFLGFLILIAIVGVSENVLDLNKGIFFYGFFFSLFLVKNKGDKQPEMGNFPVPAGNPG